MIDVKTGAHFRKKTALVSAGAAFNFFFALDAIHISRSAANVGYITFEIIHFRYLFSLGDYRFRAARYHRAPLMNGYGAEITLAVTAAMRGYRKIYRVTRSDSAFALIIRMLPAAIIEPVYFVELA
jgi:hypothetical protein